MTTAKCGGARSLTFPDARWIFFLVEAPLRRCPGPPCHADDEDKERKKSTRNPTARPQAPSALGAHACSEVSPPLVLVLVPPVSFASLLSHRPCRVLFNSLPLDDVRAEDSFTIFPESDLNLEVV